MCWQFWLCEGFYGSDDLSKLSKFCSLSFMIYWIMMNVSQVFIIIMVKIVSINLMFIHAMYFFQSMIWIVAKILVSWVRTERPIYLHNCLCSAIDFRYVFVSVACGILINILDMLQYGMTQNQCIKYWWKLSEMELWLPIRLSLLPQPHIHVQMIWSQ